MRQPRRRRCAGVLAASVLALAVPATPVRAVDEPVVSGRVLDGSGLPLAAGTVTLRERTSIVQLLGEGFVIGLSGGLLAVDCFEDDPVLRVCRTQERVSVRLGDDGRFSLPAPRGPGEYELVVNESAGTQTGPVRLNADVTVPASGLGLPDLRLWDAQVRTAVDGGDIVVSWEPVGPDVGQPVEYARVLRPDRQQAPAGADSDDGVQHEASARADARLVEDAPGRALVFAEGRAAGLDVRWSALPVPYLPVAGAPPSRGASCLAEVGAAPAAEVVPVPGCWLTDGTAGVGPDSLVHWSCRTEEGYYRCRAPPIASAVLDLGAVRPLDLVVLRGCKTCTVATSEDGAVWQDVERGFDAYALPLDGRDGRYVRLGVPGIPVGQTVETGALEELVGGPFGELVPVPAPAVPNEDFGPSITAPVSNDLSSLSEVSVWVTPPAPAAAAGPAPDPFPAPDRRASPGLVALAAALVVSAGAAVAHVRGRSGP